MEIPATKAQELRDAAERWLVLHAEFFRAEHLNLVATSKADWGVGYDHKCFAYVVTPTNAKRDAFLPMNGRPLQLYFELSHDGAGSIG